MSPSPIADILAAGISSERLQNQTKLVLDLRLRLNKPDIPVSFMEFGILRNHWNRFSNEPGSLGGAWLMQAYTTALANGRSSSVPSCSHASMQGSIEFSIGVPLRNYTTPTTVPSKESVTLCSHSVGCAPCLKTLLARL